MEKKYYIVWLSSKGSKEIYTITENDYEAKYLKETFNNFYKEREIKGRAYITICEKGKPYYHTEVYKNYGEKKK